VFDPASNKTCKITVPKEIASEFTFQNCYKYTTFQWIIPAIPEISGIEAFPKTEVLGK
jgi:hypothetical protein